MKELVPLTISSSIRKNPTVLFTNGRHKYLLHEPVNSTNHAISELYCYLFNHFKVEHLDKGVFSFQGKKYLCHEEINGAMKLDEWQMFQWKKKRQFNRFIRPRTLFDIFLTDLFFPLFGTSQIYIVPGVKDRFIVHPFPNDKRQLKFDPLPLSKSGLQSPAMRNFFKHIKSDLPEYLEYYLALYHDKFRTDIKYQISLYPDVRNEYWNEFQLCFDQAYRNYVKASITNYILQL